MRTVGVEEELLLVDPRTGRPVACASAALAATDPAPPDPEDHAFRGVLTGEIQEEQLEIATAPHTDLSALETDLRGWRTCAQAAARAVGAAVAALGTSPLAVRPTLAGTPRYRRIGERFGMTAREDLVCGCHVHVGVASPQEGVAALDRLRPWLPVVLAMSANSPFWQGEDSGYASFRSQVWLRWPSAGPTEVFGTAEEYRRAVDRMLASGVVLDEKMVYLDARLSCRYPTVEVRAADVCLRVEDAVLLAAVCRGLVDAAVHAWTSGTPAPAVPGAELRLARWQAARDGVDGRLLDPGTLRPRAAQDVVAALVEHVRPVLAAPDLALVEARAEEVLRRGPGARRQRAVRDRTGDLAEVVRDAARTTVGAA